MPHRNKYLMNYYVLHYSDITQYHAAYLTDCINAHL